MNKAGALGWLLAGWVAGSAWAGPVTLTFDQSGLVPAAGASNPIGNFYAGGSVGGMTGPSDGATFGTFAQAVTASTSSNAGPANGLGVFLLLDSAATPSAPLTTTLTISPGFSGTLTFDWSARDNFTVNLFDAAGQLSSTTFAPSNTTISSPFSAWTNASLTTNGAVATRVSFVGGSNALFLDNIAFNLQGTPGGTVPEPGSTALVGLGLVAAWAVGRRRRLA
ncbi:MAG: PEP-CTERM sorting domain-containing protein [Burkholderiales bacterium]|nr:PEP-CTERM sorting domain-containing protein [Burkholderiales bacterium]